MNMAVNSTVKEEGDVYKQDKNQEEAAAQATAAHADDSNAHEYHDTVDVVVIDIQSYIRGRERMNRREARKMFEQAAQTEYVQHEKEGIMLRAEVEERLREREREDSEVMLRDEDSAVGIVLEKLETVFYKRKLVLKKIRRSIQNTILEELAQELRSLPNTSTRSTTTGLTTGKGGSLIPLLLGLFQPVLTSIFEYAGYPFGSLIPIRKEAKDAQTELEGLYIERMSAMEALKRRNKQDETTEQDVDQEEGLDADSLEENDGKQHSRGEPMR
ncbi:hypothetical protein J4E80_008015 [Alternaria sp. BMP 0032]|nr:hypothetical protein J4E80_008015 [Alternaria sp. BMP 0032]